MVKTVSLSCKPLLQHLDDTLGPIHTSYSLNELGIHKLPPRKSRRVDMSEKEHLEMMENDKPKYHIYESSHVFRLRQRWNKLPPNEDPMCCQDVVEINHGGFSCCLVQSC